MNSNRPLTGKVEGNYIRLPGAVQTQNGEASGLDPEVLHFGGPMVLAESIGFPPGLAVGIGTVLKILPARYSELPIRLVLGTSFAWLWLTGGWWLALGSDMGLFLALNLLGRIAEGPRKRTGHGERNRRNELPD